jgi:hypothetical protein
MKRTCSKLGGKQRKADAMTSSLTALHWRPRPLSERKAMPDRRVRNEMLSLLSNSSSDDSPQASCDEVADWFESVIAELDEGPFVTTH